MDRARFAQRAELVVDVCPPHGLWLDAGELSGILDFVKHRMEGNAPLSPTEREEQAQWDHIERVRAEEGRIVEMHAKRAEALTSGGPSAAGVLAATAIAGPWAGLFVAMRGMHRK